MVHERILQYAFNVLTHVDAISDRQATLHIAITGRQCGCCCPDASLAKYHLLIFRTQIATALILGPPSLTLLHDSIVSLVSQVVYCGSICCSCTTVNVEQSENSRSCVLEPGGARNWTHGIDCRDMEERRCDAMRCDSETNGESLLT